MADPGVEWRRTVVLSTGHLTKDTARRGDNAVSEKDPVLFPWTYGYMAYAYPERSRLLNIPDDLWDCCEWANKQKEDPEEPIYIFFDQDGPEMDGLPTYDW